MTNKKQPLPIATSSPTRKPMKEPYTSEQRFFLWICLIVVSGVVFGLLGTVYLITH